MERTSYKVEYTNKAGAHVTHLVHQQGEALKLKTNAVKKEYTAVNCCKLIRNYDYTITAIPI